MLVKNDVIHLKIGLARFTKKGELQSKIDRKNEEIDILKLGLSGNAKRYGYQNVQEFYRTYRKSYSVYAKYREQVAEWEKTYGGDNQKQNKRSVLERVKNPQKKVTDYQQQSAVKSKDQGKIMLLGRLDKNLYSQLWVAKKNFNVGGKQYCYFV